MATIPEPTVSTLPDANAEIIAEPLNGWITNIKTFIEAKNIDESNVNTSSANGIVGMSLAQIISGNKTFSGTSVFSGTFTATGGGALTGTWTDLGTVTTVDINGGTWQGTIDGNWTAASQTCADLGTITTVDINSGTFDGTVGGTTPAAGTFTDLASTGDTTIGNATGDALTFHPSAWTLTNAVTVTGTWTDIGIITTADINGGTVDGATIGGAVAGAGTFTDLVSTGDTTIGNATGDGLTFHPSAWTLTNAVSITGTWTDIGTVSTMDLNGGTIDGVTIGGAAAGAGTFTDLTSTGNTTIGNATGDALTFHPSAWTLTNAVSITGTWADLGTVTTVDINGGTIDGTAIGGASTATGAFTTGTFSSTLGVTGASTLGSTVISPYSGTSGPTLAMSNPTTDGVVSMSWANDATTWTLYGVNGANGDLWQLFNMSTLALSIAPTTVAVTMPGALNVMGAATFSDDILTNANKSSDIGASATAWDDVYADDFQNVADFLYLDVVDDLQAIRDIKPSGEIDIASGLPMIDDDTLPDWALSRYGKEVIQTISAKDEDSESTEIVHKIGDVMRTPEGRPYISLRMKTSWNEGAIRALDARVTENYTGMTGYMEGYLEMKDEISYLKDKIAVLEKAA